MEISGARVLVTGGSRGIGAAVVHELRARGARVCVYGRAEGDLSRSDTISADTDLGDYDIVVLNAGRGYSGALTDMSLDQIDELLTLNLRSVVALTRSLLPGMIDRGHGHLCFVSSIAARTIVAGEAVYSAAKSGVDAFAESLRAELAGTGVGVSVVVPGVVDTEFFAARGRPYDRKSPRPIPATRVALATVRAIEGDHAEVFVPAWLRIAPVVRAIAPRTFRALTAKFGERVHLANSATRQEP